MTNSRRISSRKTRSRETHKKSARGPSSAAAEQAATSTASLSEGHTGPGIIAADERSEVKQLRGVVKLVASDIGHVLVDFDWSEVSRGFCERFNLSMEEFRKVLKHVGGLGYESGDTDTAGVVQAINDFTCGDLTVAEFDVLWNQGFHENQEVALVLNRLAESYRIFAISNTNESHWTFFTHELKIDRHFTGLILSYVVRASKPDRRIYLELLEQAGVKADECLFIDDLERNIEAARELGMHAILFVGVEDLKQRLNEMGLLS